MKAYVLHEIDNFVLEERERPAPGASEVLLKVRAAGICGSDIPRIYTSGTYHYPLIPGHEFSGEVVETGAGVQSDWMGRRVGVFPLIPCRECVPCGHGQYELCRHYSYLGSRTDGGFAEYVKVPEWNLLKLPGNVSYEQAAMLEPMAVAVHALRRARPRPADWVFVCGLGAIGLLVTMFCMDMGIENICVIGNKNIQKEMALRLGVKPECYCDIRLHDAAEWVRERTDGMGADVFFDCVGKDGTLSLAVDNTAPNGTVQLVGNPVSDMTLEKSVYWKILRNQLTVLGTWNSSFSHTDTDDWNFILKELAAEKIHPEFLITHTYGMEDFGKGFVLMRDKAEEYVKVMLMPEGEPFSCR